MAHTAVQTETAFASGSPPAGWTQADTANGGEVYFDGTYPYSYYGGYATIYPSSGSYSNNQYSEAIVSTTSIPYLTTTAIRPMVQCQGAGGSFKAYMLSMADDGDGSYVHIGLYEITAGFGSISTLVSPIHFDFGLGGEPFGSNKKFCLELVGNDLKAYWDGTLISELNYTIGGSPLSGGRPGFAILDNVSNHPGYLFVEQWEGGNVGASAAIPKLAGPFGGPFKRLI